MAVAVRSKLPPLTLSTEPSTLESEATHPALVKETSTVGDLISFTDRGPRRSSPVKSNLRRRSVGDIESFGDKRRKSLQRQGSLKGLPLAKANNRGHTLTPSQNEQSPTSPEKDDIPITSRRRISRRESIMNALRDDLEKIPCLHALRRFSSVTSQEDDDGKVFGDSDVEDDQLNSTTRRYSRRTSGVIRCDSRWSDSSQESNPGILTETELRKLQMIHALNKMDGKGPNTARKVSIDSQTGEVAVLEASFLRGGKRGSIATHVLMKARSRRKNPEIMSQKPNDIIIPDNVSQRKRTDSEERADQQKEKSMKIFQMLKKAEKPKLAAIGGSISETPTSMTREDSVKEGVLQSFRKRLRRKKV